MDFHAFMYGVVGRRHELERGMAGEILPYFSACWMKSEPTLGFVMTPDTRE